MFQLGLKLNESSLKLNESRSTVTAVDYNVSAHCTSRPTILHVPVVFKVYIYAYCNYGNYRKLKISNAYSV